MSYDLDELERLRLNKDKQYIDSNATFEDFIPILSTYVKALLDAAPAMFVDLRRLKAENAKLKTIIEKADQYLLTSEWDWKEEAHVTPIERIRLQLETNDES